MERRERSGDAVPAAWAGIDAGLAKRWTEVDRYLAERLAPGEAALTAALEASAAAGLPAIDVSAVQSALLELLARLCGARAILEIGTLGGYSTIWLARALPPDGRLVTLEADPQHAAVARDNLARSGLSDVVEVVEGRRGFPGVWSLCGNYCDTVTTPGLGAWVSGGCAV